MTLDMARCLGIRRVRRPCWPQGFYLELVRPDEVPGPPPPLTTAHYTAAILFRAWDPFDRLYWRLPWEDYEEFELRGED
jgi:hypothetical protein